LGEEYVASGANLEVVLPVGGSLIVEGWTNKDAGITLAPDDSSPATLPIFSRLWCSTWTATAWS